jgi:hypothetical protein
MKTKKLFFAFLPHTWGKTPFSVWQSALCPASVVPFASSIIQLLTACLGLIRGIRFTVRAYKLR